MPIIGDTSKTPPVQKPVPVKIAAPEFKGVTVDSRYVPATSLLAHVEGASWSVHYYSQVLGSDNALSGQNINRSATIQQYRAIENLQLKVISPLMHSQDSQTKQRTVKGQAHLYSCGVIPNEGDCFLADIGDGREGLFEVRSTESRMWLKDAVFVVDYEIVDYSEKDARVEDLNSKVIQRLHYVHDYLMHGQNPLITTDEKHQLDSLRGMMAELVDHYFTRFYSREVGTLLLPGQDFAIYDPLLTHAVLAMFRDEAHPNIKQIRELNVDEDDNYTAPSIWSALLHKRRRDLKVGVTKQIGLVRTGAFSIQPRMNSVRYSGVAYVTYPTQPDKSEDYRRKDYTKPLSDYQMVLTPPRYVDLFDLLQVDELYGLNLEHLGTPKRAMPAINPITHASYVFSEAFYRKAQDGQSVLELLMQQYLDDKPLSLHALTMLSNSYTSWGVLEQFYQLPIVMAMIRAAIRRN